MTDEESTDEPDSIPLSELRSDIEESTAREPGNGENERKAGGSAPESEERTDSIPLSGLRDSVAEKEANRKAEGEVEEAFVEQDVEAVDTDGIWADLLMEDGTPEGQFEATVNERGADGRTQIISKHICERCQYVSKPPELSCTHEGTTIHELVDVDHVRVQQCPMVGPDGEKKDQGSSGAEDT